LRLLLHSDSVATVFFRSPYQYVRDAGKPAVLALYSDPFLGEIRIKPFLNALLARGVIADYVIADRSMHPIGPRKSARFTHVWCQRNVSTAQFRFLKRHADAPIIYDIDDLITSVPDFVMKTRARTIRRVNWCLQRANAVTVASQHLKTYLCEDVPGITAKIVILKNGCTDTAVPRHEPRKRLIWTSGDIPFFTDENPTFVAKLADLVNHAGYEAVLIGRFDAASAAGFHQGRIISHLDFASYREFLKYSSGALGLAPLPTRFPRNAQRYFDAKSDIKLVDFLCSGLIPLFSTAIPYTSSELFLPRLGGADANELLGKLEMCMAKHAGMIEHVNETVHASGKLNSREFVELSTALDQLFQ
jgi:hypothetical protein